MNMTHDIDQLRREAADRTPDALFALAQALIAQGEPEEASEPLRVASQAGHAGAQVELGRMLLYGVGTQGDVPQAVDWLKRAEGMKHPGASYLLASIGLAGVATDRDLELIARQLLHAAQAGIVPAVRALAMYFGRQRDNRVAMQQSEALLAQAAARNDGVSAALLAERIRHGELAGDARYALASLDAIARRSGITAMPSLAGVPVVAGSNGPLQLDLEPTVRAPAFVECSPAPRVAMTEGLLSNEECRYVIAMGSPHLRRANVADPLAGGGMEHPARSNDDASFDPLMEDFQLRLLQLRMAGAIGMEFVCAEPMVLLHYRPGQEYLPHHDYLLPETLAANQPGAGQRVATLFCYLSNVEAGGETYFPKLERVIPPSPGRAVAFRNLDAAGRPDPDTLHAGLPVQKGEKWLATLWLRERRYRDF
jgi:TPR repeat protein